MDLRFFSGVSCLLSPAPADDKTRYSRFQSVPPITRTLTHPSIFPFCKGDFGSFQLTFSPKATGAGWAGDALMKVLSACPVYISSMRDFSQAASRKAVTQKDRLASDEQEKRIRLEPAVLSEKTKG
jgi:hypothetical protein